MTTRVSSKDDEARLRTVQLDSTKEHEEGADSKKMILGRMLLVGALRGSLNTSESGSTRSISVRDEM